MAADPTSRFADLPLYEVTASDGTTRHVIGLRIPRPTLGTPIGRRMLREGDGVDLVAQEGLEVAVELPELGAVLLRDRERVDRVEHQVAEE